MTGRGHGGNEGTCGDCQYFKPIKQSQNLVFGHCRFKLVPVKEDSPPCEEGWEWDFNG